MSDVTLLCLVGPSGVGKTTIAENMFKYSHKAHTMILSHTTRQKRVSEEDGRDYHFVDDYEFSRISRSTGFIEEVEFYDNRYGISEKECMNKLLRSINMHELNKSLHECNKIWWTQPNPVATVVVNREGVTALRDWASTLTELDVDVRAVLVVPPNAKALGIRLEGRGESADTVIKRLSNYAEETKVDTMFDFVYVNYAVNNIEVVGTDLLGQFYRQLEKE